MRADFRLAFVVSTLVLATSATANGQGIGGGEIEVRFAQLTPAAGHVRMQRPKHGQHLYVERRALFEPSDIEHVRVTVTGERVILDVRLKPDADLRVAQQSPRRVGSYVVLLVEGQLIDAWRIVGKIGGTLTRNQTMSANVSELPAGSLQRIAARWPPREQ